MRHVHILDPQLSGVGGHYLTHDAQLVRDLQRRGIPHTLYGRKKRDVSECCGQAVVPVFTHDIFQEACHDSVVWPIENFNAINEAFLADLATIDLTAFSADDLVYFPNLLQNQVYAIAQWIARIPTDRRPTVALMFRYLNHAMDYVQARQNKEMIALYYRYAVRQLIGSHARTLICADTAELAKAYRQITGAPVLELPNPMDVSALLAEATPRHPNERPVVVYQGHTSPLRGFHFLPEIIDRCASMKPRPRFIIQLQNRENALAMKLGPVIERLERLQGDNVQLLHGPLSADDYLKLLSSADIVLLPYSPSFYGHGSSGVFTEAASIGKVVVATNGTVPIRQGREYQLGVVAAPQWTPASMAEAVATALQKLPALRTQAEANAPRFREENCARALWDRLLTSVQTLTAAQTAVAA